MKILTFFILTALICSTVSCVDEDDPKRDHSLTGSISYSYNILKTKIFRNGELIEGDPVISYVIINKASDTEVYISFYCNFRGESGPELRLNVSGIAVTGKPYDVQLSHEGNNGMFVINGSLFPPVNIKIEGWMRSDYMLDLMTRGEISTPSYDGEITALFTLEDGSEYRIEILIEAYR